MSLFYTSENSFIDPPLSAEPLAWEISARKFCISWRFLGDFSPWMAVFSDIWGAFSYISFLSVPPAGDFELAQLCHHLKGSSIVRSWPLARLTAQPPFGRRCQLVHPAVPAAANPAVGANRPMWSAQSKAQTATLKHPATGSSGLLWLTPVPLSPISSSLPSTWGCSWPPALPTGQSESTKRRMSWIWASGPYNTKSIARSHAAVFPGISPWISK